MPAPTPKSGRLQRRVVQQPWVANSQTAYDLPRGYDLNAVQVRVSGTIIVTVAVTAIRANAPAQLISSIDVFADGNKNYNQNNGIMTAIGNAQRQFASSLAPPGAVAPATYTVSASYRLDRVNADGPRPKDSSLHTVIPFMSLLQCRLTTGAATDIFDMTAGTLTTITLNNEISLDETMEFNPADRLEGRFIKRISFQDSTPTAANTNLQFQLPVGQYLRGVHIFATDSAAANPDTGSNVLINNVLIRSGVDRRIDLPYDILRSQNSNAYKVPIATVPPGYAFGDCCPDGRLNQLFDLRGVSQAFLELDVAAPVNTARIRLQIEEFMWQEGIAPAA